MRLACSAVPTAWERGAAIIFTRVSDTLFALPDSPSPRLKWLARHGLTLRNTESGRHECVLDDENVGSGESIDEACVALCVETGLRHWAQEDGA